MKNSRSRERWFQQFMRWAEGEDPEQDRELADAPERAQFVEYLEYLDSHEPVSYDAYRQMRSRELVAKGIASQEISPGHGEPEPGGERGEQVPYRRYRPGRLRRRIRQYQVLSVAVALVLMTALFLVAISLPGFGDREAPGINSVSQRYLEQGLEETGAVNAVAGMILDYRAFDTFGESTVLFAATMSVILLLRRPGIRQRRGPSRDRIFRQMGLVLLPAILMFGVYVILNGHISPGGGFSGGTVLGCGLILGAMVLGQARIERLLSPRRTTVLTVGCLMAYGLMKGYSFFTGANHVGWEVPKGTPGAILSAGLILPLNLCVGVIVACTMYTFYTLFAGEE